jgi:hypothetical protein
MRRPSLTFFICFLNKSGPKDFKHSSGNPANGRRKLIKGTDNKGFIK